MHEEHVYAEANVFKFSKLSIHYFIFLAPTKIVCVICKEYAILEVLLKTWAGVVKFPFFQWYDIPYL